MTTDISVVRWDPSQANSEYIDEYEYDGGNSSSRLFERSRIKALAGKQSVRIHHVPVHRAILTPVLFSISRPPCRGT